MIHKNGSQFMQTLFKTHMDKTGRIAIPPEIIMELKLKPGVELGITEEDGKITLEPLSEEPEIIEKDGLLVVRPKITGNIEDFVKEVREQRMSELMKDIGV